MGNERNSQDESTRAGAFEQVRAPASPLLTREWRRWITELRAARSFRNTRSLVRVSLTAITDSMHTEFLGFSFRAVLTYKPLIPANVGEGMALERGDLLASAITEQRDVGLPILRSRAKRATDVSIAAIALVVCALLMALVAVAILASSGRPVLFTQERVGKDGSRFRCWKFRTMVRGADALHADLIPLNEAPFPAFKMSRDPRVTRIGHLLRRSSVDELPQLWNVLRGDMSMVGPRPPLPSEVAHYDSSALQRLAVRPGLTCTWQIHSRNGSPMTFEEWVRSDLDYIRKWSLGGDLRLLVRTLAVVARMGGR